MSVEETRHAHRDGGTGAVAPARTARPTGPGEDVVITRDGKPVARLSYDLPVGVPIPGRGKGKLVIVSDDDGHLDGFAEYM